MSKRYFISHKWNEMNEIFEELLKDSNMKWEGGRSTRTFWGTLQASKARGRLPQGKG
jgi:hypothetical protein